MPSRSRRNRWKFRRLGAWLMTFTGTLVMAIGSNWASDGITWESGGLRLAPPITLLGIASFMAGAALVYRFGRQLLPITSLRQRNTPNPRKVLIIFLSEKRHYDLLRGPRGWQISSMRNGSPGEAPQVIDLPDRLEETTRLTAPHWSWQQMLRAIEAHPHVERIYLIGSQGGSQGDSAASSCEHAALAGELIRTYRPSVSIDIRPRPGQGVDFEDMSALLDEIDSILDHAGQQGYEESDVMIDITGGQKTASIAGALATLHRSALEFQYVSTHAPYRIIRFNASTERGGDF